MMKMISAAGLEHKELNEAIREAGRDVKVTCCCGQRFIGAGASDRQITIEGVPGNALGAYLNGASITVYGNAQDAVGDTMNDGTIMIHGNIGDAAGYAMRGGEMYIRGNAGYRAGIHMKEYKTKKPVLVIGGHCGSFLGEYQAGGVIIVLGLTEGRMLGNFPCTGMHGGKMFLRGNAEDVLFPMNVIARPATAEDLEEITPYLKRFCKMFDVDEEKLLSEPFTIVVPDSNNPFKQMYVPN